MLRHYRANEFDSHANNQHYIFEERAMEGQGVVSVNLLHQGGQAPNVSKEELDIPTSRSPFPVIGP